MKRLLGVLAGLCVALAACGGGAHPSGDRGSSPAAPAGSTPAAAATVSPAWTAQLQAVAQPVVSGRTVVAIVRDRTGLAIVGLDVASGKERWRHAYATEGGASGQPVDLRVYRSTRGHDFVAFYQPEDAVAEADPEPLTVVDVATGDIAQNRDDLQSHDEVVDCGGGIDVCVVADYIPDYAQSAAHAVRLDLATGRVSPLRGLPDQVRSVGDSLWATPDRPGERIIRSGARGPVWSVSDSEAFGAGYSTDNGWSFDLDSSTHTYVGELGQDFPQSMHDAYDAGRPVTYRLGYGALLVGLDARSGKVRWRAPGVTFNGCPGGELDVLADKGIVIGCRWHGTRTEQQGRRAKTRGAGLDVVGLDVETGRQRWSLRVTDKDRALIGVRHVTPLASDGLVVQTASGYHYLSSAGDRGVVDPSTVLLCSKAVGELRLPRMNRREGGELYFRCTPDGRKTDKPLTPFGLGAVTPVSGWSVFAEEGRIVGYRA